MTLDEFKTIVSKRIIACTDLMYGSKNNEYSRNNDKFHNFKRAGSMRNRTPEDALLGMGTKQFVSIFDIVDDIEAGKPVPSQAVIDEKFNDAHNYLFLLEGIIAERRGLSNVEIELEPTGYRYRCDICKTPQSIGDDMFAVKCYSGDVSQNILVCEDCYNKNTIRLYCDSLGLRPVTEIPGDYNG